MLNPDQSRALFKHKGDPLQYLSKRGCAVGDPLVPIKEGVPCFFCRCGHKALVRKSQLLLVQKKEGGLVAIG